MIRKFGEAEHITSTDDTTPDGMHKEAATKWTPQDTAELAQENEDLRSPGMDPSSPQPARN